MKTATDFSSANLPSAEQCSARTTPSETRDDERAPCQLGATDATATGVTATGVTATGVTTTGAVGVAGADAGAQSPLRTKSPRPRWRFVLERRVFIGLLMLMPTAIQVGFDFHRRAPRLLGLVGQYRTTYLLAVAESLVVSSLLVIALSRRRSRWSWVFVGLFVLMFTVTLGGQGYFFDQYNAYLNTDVSVFASNLMDSVISQLFADFANYLRCHSPPLVLSLLIVFVGRRYLRPRRSRARVAVILALPALVGSFFIPTQHRQVQASTPDVLYLNAVGGLIKTQLGMTEQAGQLRPKARNSLPVPPLTVRLPAPRNVILIQLESVRADAVCTEYDPACTHTPATNGLFPKRFPLRQMRSIASTTSMCSAALWGGLAPTESREILHTWPLIYDYARAAGYHTAYFTAQNLMFGNARLWVKNLGVERTFSATDVDPDCDLDMGAREYLMADRLIQEFDTLPEPFAAVVQMSNVHFPYYVDPNFPEPFQPADLSKASQDLVHFFNHYLNAVHQQDLHLARFLTHLMQSPKGARTVIVYTSDHGESFREHGTSGHTFSVMDEEIHVPTWIAAPDGVLTEAEQASLTAKRDAPLTHLDLSVTLLDLLGIWDDPGIAKYKQRLAGMSLLRPGLNQEPIAISNCTGVWSCAFENWGVLQGMRKLEAREWDQDWRCWDLSTDPFEEHDLGVAACADLLAVANRVYGRMPGPNRN
jgi:phosphoglycerol transferase MdoB-like AlkP superfamily enzyme